MPEGHIQVVIADQNENEDKDDEIADQARELRRLDIFQQGNPKAPTAKGAVAAIGRSTK
jgi:hypothetical protein